MRRNFILTQSVLLNSIILSALFVMGGATQLFSHISITKTNILISMGIVFLQFISGNKLYPFGNKNYLFPLSFLCVYILLSAFFHHSSVLYCIAYLYLLIAIPLISSMFSEKLLGKNPNCFEFTKYFFYALTIFQIPILLLQNAFPEILSSLTWQYSLNIIDTIDLQFGSFFIKSDYTLTMLMNILLANKLWQSEKKNLTCLLWILLFLLVIIMTNSKIGVLVFFVVITIYLIEKALKHIRFSPVFLSVLIVGIIVILISTLNIQSIIDQIFHEMQAIDYRANKGLQVSRYGVLSQLLSSKINFWGNGIFDYYNYFFKTWKFYAGHSLWLTVYFEIGIIGVILTLWFFWGIIHPSIKKSGEGVSYFFILVMYSFISVLLSDLGAMIIIFFFLYTYPSTNKCFLTPQS